MSDKSRFVFDANAIISAALFKGSTPDQALTWALGHGQILISRESIIELQEVFARPKFDRYLIQEERDSFLAKLIQLATTVEVSQLVDVCRDPRDDKYLALAITGHASHIISGDADLLVLESFEGIPILSPAEFLALQHGS